MHEAYVFPLMLDADPRVIRTTVNESWFPKKDPRAGGTIYIWPLGSNKTAPVLAREFGHDEAFRALMERTPDGMRLSTACELGDEALCRRLIAAHAGLAGTLGPDERRKVADAAQANNTNAVRLMVESGWPVDARGQHRATPLHWAAFNGNAEMARLLLAHRAPVDIKGDEFDATPLGWATHGAEHGPHCKTGDYAGTIKALRAAGA